MHIVANYSSYGYCSSGGDVEVTDCRVRSKSQCVYKPHAGENTEKSMQLDG